MIVNDGVSIGAGSALWREGDSSVGIPPGVIDTLEITCVSPTAVFFNN